MEFDPTKYGPAVARLLALEENGQRLLPLTCGPCVSRHAREALTNFKPAVLFPGRERPEAPMTGLWLYFSCFNEAHELADRCLTPEGELWHAILHRQEPDSGNAAYWFRRAGCHPMFADLARESAKVTHRFPEAEFRVSDWDPFAFITFCERARQQPGSAQEQAAREIQRAEWQILFDYSAMSPQ
ncbi:MAG: hypothetical protein ACRD5L_06045 [Bryobacteraceae bacterium]